MKNLVSILIFTISFHGYSQYTNEKLFNIYMNSSRIDTISKLGSINNGAYLQNDLNYSEYIELNRIIGNEKIEKSVSLTINFKISPDGRIYFVKDCKGLSKKAIPEELRGIPAFDNTDNCKNQELINFLNHYFDRKRIKFKFYKNKERTQEITDLSIYSEYVFRNDNLKFYLEKHYPLIIMTNRKKS